jgi:hypothetical protein
MSGIRTMSIGGNGSSIDKRSMEYEVWEEVWTCADKEGRHRGWQLEQSRYLRHGVPVTVFFGNGNCPGFRAYYLLNHITYYKIY